MDIFGVIAGLIAFIVILFLYFLPYIVANRRKHKNAGAIGILNFFLGWTLIGWVIALVWAYTANTKV